MIVLTGGAGFIGSCFLRTLNNKGVKDVLVVDHLGQSAKWKNLHGKQFESYLHKNDFRNKLNSGEFDGKIDAIFHLGACSSTTENDMDYLFDNNYSYSVDIAKFAVRENVRLIYASSAATYGDGAKGYDDKNYDDLVPLNGYGFSKHIFDLWVLNNAYDKIFTGLKFFNVFGPNEYHKGSMASMVYKSYNQIIQTGKVNLFRSNTPEYKDGGQMRDFVYVKDACEIMWQIYMNPEISGIFNIGTGVARSWNDLARSVFASMDLEPVIEYVDMPESLTNQYQNYTKADMSKLFKSGVNYKPADLEVSVDDYVREYLSKNYLTY
ncbi:MAG: ADP-glyceromanno-heptose 6-epimerase [Candidatus Kapaibacterium sp.]|jgi:ADP-L-glycero-D-manno-heptose 6-epimerase|nr:ADP-glyceromanno-heptose 6-epimerase [Candidatus Kapabacteria bacterium]